ncbi:ROK family protein [Vagococcus elongatus]|uniref:Sugar kinase n=1 Tax=Vagococcus elongatus TaxID=180344 RepID=A0A430B4H4_9ENTE|nr:ROK family protein [Vagococcus elongatus]RSU15151.1 sugar kinase [Vagococcus elongatus]
MYIGFDIGGTSIKYGVLNEQGEIIEKAMISTNHEKESLLQDLANITKKYQQQYPDIKGIGVSAPGIIQKDGFMTTAGAIRPLYETNLKEEIEQRTGLPTAVENDANAAAIAEKWLGAAQGIDNYLCMVLGTGVGGGIVINGEVYRGAHGMAGEFGYMMINELPTAGNIEHSSLNLRGAVVGGLSRLYNAARKKEHPETEETLGAKEIFQRAEDGEPLAGQILARYYEELASGLLSLLSAFDPEVILIGGGISANEVFMTGLQEKTLELAKRHGSISFLLGKTIGEIKQAKLKNDAGMIGAVYLVKQLVD